MTIITEDATAADALSTALFTVSIDDGTRILKNYTDNTGNEASAVWILNETQMHSTGKEKDHKGFVIVYTDDLSSSILWD